MRRRPALQQAGPAAWRGCGRRWSPFSPLCSCAPPARGPSTPAAVPLTAAGCSRRRWRGLAAAAASMPAPPPRCAPRRSARSCAARAAARPSRARRCPSCCATWRWRRLATRTAGACAALQALAAPARAAFTATAAAVPRPQTPPTLAAPAPVPRLAHRPCSPQGRLQAAAFLSDAVDALDAHCPVAAPDAVRGTTSDASWWCGALEDAAAVAACLAAQLLGPASGGAGAGGGVGPLLPAMRRLAELWEEGTAAVGGGGGARRAALWAPWVVELVLLAAGASEEVRGRGQEAQGSLQRGRGGAGPDCRGEQCACPRSSRLHPREIPFTPRP
jgi:hypothetical protein